MVHIIAEAGTNHGGKLSVAKSLIDVAITAGANSVKVQLIYSEGLYLPEFFRDGKYCTNEAFEKHTSLMLSDDDYRRLADYCREKGTQLSASVFDSRGIKLLDKLDPPYFKIASCELNNSRLLAEAAERGRRMVISTGMATMVEIDRAIRDVTAVGNFKIVLMHCTSLYPCLMEHMNLSFLKSLKDKSGFPVGLSDHTEDSLAATMAVAMGAEWIEKHFTLDRKARGFDHFYAMEPASLAGFVRDVRAAEQTCRYQNKRMSSDELSVKSVARRGLYAARDIQVGETLAKTDVLVVRPESTLQPNDLTKVVGKRTNRLIRRYESLYLDQFVLSL